MSGSKVKILLNKKGSPRRRLPKAPLPEADATDLQEQSTIYLRECNKTMRLKSSREAILLAQARNQLIERALVELQLAFLFTAMRRKLQSLPGRLYEFTCDLTHFDDVESAEDCALMLISASPRTDPDSTKVEASIMNVFLLSLPGSFERGRKLLEFLLCGYLSDGR